MLPLFAGTIYGLAAPHVFWACGGRWGKGAAIPEVNGVPTFRPSRRGTCLVAAALAAAATVVLAQARMASLGPFAQWVFGAAVGAGLVFLARAIGEFRLVGFFKRVRHTPFARRDDAVYSPLCLVLGVGILWLVFRP